ncbi:helix-turn-helix domain-containing protein [Cohaesibacter haloalkalitolerans]|uniref:helix-turn-helix domain-containing protein n=1 Tax=Cohaesibacter haloalkalitolerans TaxID=1162980 RepID=UPI0013C45931|nr:AraC family transcriptional regulator [Cohaesibacter haloalkalitolerans]
MPTIPLPFIATGILLAVIAALLLRGMRNRWFLIFLGVAALQTTIVGLRWSTDLSWLHHIQPVFASIVPLSAFLAFSDLDGRRPSWRHMVWPLAMVIALLWLPAAIDMLLSLEFLCYGWFIYTGKPADGVSPNARLGSETTIAHMRKGVAAALVLSAASDVIVSAVLNLGYTSLAAPVVATTLSAVLLVIIGGLLGRTGLEMPPEPNHQMQETEAPETEIPEAIASQAFPEEPATSAPLLAEEEARETLATVEALLRQGLYKDHDLTLARLARRAHIPARTISRAVNQLHGFSITDLVNRYRVEEARRLLKGSNLPVTEIMLDAGFQTKSNFNRVFKELEGQTPTAFRQSGT